MEQEVQLSQCARWGGRRTALRTRSQTKRLSATRNRRSTELKRPRTHTPATRRFGDQPGADDCREVPSR